MFEYADAVARQTESEQISPEGSAIGTSMITWVDRPNIWANGRLIVLYVGAEAILEVLQNVLGDQITNHID